MSTWVMLRGVLVTVLSLLALGGCGGGGSAGDSATPTGAAVAINPGTAAIDAGQSLLLRVTGGAGPYRLISGNPQVLPVPALVNNAYSANIPVTAGSARETETVEVTVTDSKGASATAKVTVRYVPMAVTPSALSLAATRTQVFRLVGGLAPFTVTTTRPDLLQVGMDSRSFWVKASEVAAQVDDVGVSVMDAAGNTVSAKISIMPLFVFSSIQVDPSGTDSNGTVSAVTAGQRGVIQIQMADAYPAPRTLTLTQVSGDYSLDGADAQGRLQLDVGNDYLAFATLSASVGAVTQAGKLRVTDDTTGKFVDHMFQIAGVKLSAAPSDIKAISRTSTCLSGGVGQVQVMGGTPPYTILSSSPSVVTATPSTVAQSGGSATLTGYGVCSDNAGVDLTVIDAVGATTLISFTSLAQQ